MFLATFAVCWDFAGIIYISYPKSKTFHKNVDFWRNDQVDLGEVHQRQSFNNKQKEIF